MHITEKTKSELLHVLNTKKMFGLEYINQVDFQNFRTTKLELPLNIDSLNEHILNCSLCELSKIKTFSPFVHGTMNSKIFVITLNDNIEMNKKEYINFENILNININDIYMTNILKCSVNKYKFNLDTEVEKCITYLEQQIVILKPETIITFGIAFKYLMKNDDDIIDVSGNLYNYKGINLIPLLSIDFVNKNPSYKDKMLIDLKKIKKIMDEK